MWRHALHGARDGDDYILNGEKMWITLSNVADRFLVSPRPTRARANGITGFILERGWRGLTTGTIEGKMGVRASNTGWISMHDVRVPRATAWVRRGGFKIAMSALDNARYGVAAGAVGIMKACLDDRLNTPSSARPSAAPIAEYRTVQQMLANMQQSIDAGQLLVWKAGWLKNQGIRNTRETNAWPSGSAPTPPIAAPTTPCGFTAPMATSDEYNVERHLRNTKSAVIYEGTSQIHMLVQAAYALGEREIAPCAANCPPTTRSPGRPKANSSRHKLR